MECKKVSAAIKQGCTCPYRDINQHAEHACFAYDENLVANGINCDTQSCDAAKGGYTIKPVRTQQAEEEQCGKVEQGEFAQAHACKACSFGMKHLVAIHRFTNVAKLLQKVFVELFFIEDGQKFSDFWGILF